MIQVSKYFEIKNELAKKILPTLLLLIALHFFYSHIGIYQYLDKRPCSFHSSAQCLRASIAQNYYEVDMNFFKPRVNKDAVGNGITGPEFPIIYYIAAILYKLFGFNEIYLKIISLIIFTIGLVFLNLLILRIIKNYILSLAIISSIICSPVVLYYTPNFMPDVPSISFVLCFWYFFFSYLKSNSNKDLNWMIFFGTLASLIKSIALMGFIIIIFLIILEYWGFFKSTQQQLLFKNKKQLLFKTLTGFLIVFIWYAYATWLSKTEHNELFLLAPRKVNDWETANRVLDNIKNMWLFHYYSYETYVFIAAIILILSIGYKFVSRLLFSITILYFLGSCFYVYFFFYQFLWHDYYMIAVFPLIVMLFITFTDFINRINDRFLKLTKLIVFVIIFFNVKECLRWTEYMYKDRYSDYAIQFYGNYSSYETLEPKLRSLGIKREDKTLFFFDESFCNALYLSNQLGYSSDRVVPKQEVENLMNDLKFKYLVLNDSILFNKIYGKDISGKVISNYKDLIIYKIH